MPDAIITSTESTFGTISGTFAADQSTVTGTIAGVITGTLTGSVGVPGPAGPVGPQGPQGEPGEPGAPGQGVPAGGTEGQIIVKASETDYDTVWVDNSAETLTAVVRNETGATLTKGTVVYISGAAGNKALVSKASASSEAGSSKTFAILKDDILNNQNGVAVTVGLLKGLNTLAFTEGANLWLSTTPGEITQTPPASPNHAVFLGNVTRVHANQGTIEVRIQNGYELGELHDVLITSPTNGQVLKYDSATSLWKNGLDAGLPAGGTAGQFLQKIDGVDYNTDWVTVNLGNYLVKSNNLSDLTSTSDARDNLQLGTLNNPTFAGLAIQGAGANLANLGATYLTLNHSLYGSFSIDAASGITFPDASVQTTAFPAGSDMPMGGMTGQVLTKQSNGNYDADWQTISTTTSWGSITGTLSSQTDLQSALDGKYSTTNPAGYITSAALTPYLLSSTAASTYYPLTNPAGYITSSALAGYATESWVTSQGYITSAALSPYLTSATAASTYQTIAGMSSYLTTSAAAATYQTQAAMASYATESWVTSQGYLTDAPSDGNQYARKNGAWDIVSGGGSSYITSVTSPLLVTSGDLSIDLTGYATESWVTSQGYITSVNFFPLSQDLGFDTSSAEGRLLVDGVYDPTSSGFTSSRINIGSTLPSSPLNGDFWSNGSKFRYTLGGTTYDIASESWVSGTLTSYAQKASPALTGVPTAPTAAVGTNTTQIATTAFVIANAGGGGGGGGVDIQTFGSPTTSGTFTWTKPAGAQIVEVFLWAPGNNGQYGARQPTTVARTGGGGGGAGGFIYGKINADSLGSTETVTIPAGNLSAAGRTTNGVAGGNANWAGGGLGLPATFGPFRAAGGAFGSTTIGSNVYGVAVLNVGAGTTGGTTNGPSATSQNRVARLFPLGGGAGGGANANVTTSTTGGNGGGYTATNFDCGTRTAIAGGAGGNTTTAPNGGNGVSASGTGYEQGGTGGGGGAYRTGQDGGNGGNGGWPGGGGGGGAAADEGFTSGSGGAGANGFLVVITWLG